MKFKAFVAVCCILLLAGGGVYLAREYSAHEDNPQVQKSDVKGQKVDVSLADSMQALNDDALDFTFQFPAGWEYSVRQANNDTAERLFSDTQHRLVMKLTHPDAFPTFLQSYALVGADKLIATNDEHTKLYYALYRRQDDVQAVKTGGFATVVWESGRSEYTDLKFDNPKNAWMLEVELDNVAPSEESALLSAVDTMLGTFSFKNKSATADSITYEDKKYGFVFSYPKNFVVASSPFHHFTDADTFTAFTINYPSNYLDGTNAHTALITAEVVNVADASNCLKQITNSSSTTSTPINGTPFIRSSGNGAAAGSRYESVAYGHIVDGRCYVISALFGWGVLENYDEAKRPKQFDDKPALEVFEQIVKTYRLI